LERLSLKINLAKVVFQLVDEFEFDGVDAGNLDESWRQQPATPVYGTNLDANSITSALGDQQDQRYPSRGDRDHRCPACRHLPRVEKIIACSPEQRVRSIDRQKLSAMSLHEFVEGQRGYGGQISKTNGYLVISPDPFFQRGGNQLLFGEAQKFTLPRQPLELQRAHHHLHEMMRFLWRPT
jgi:hypothetical protein